MKVTPLSTQEFIRRFLVHALPSGFHRIRHTGFLANGTAQRDWANGALYGIAIQLDAAGRQEQAKAAPVFGDVFERFAQRGFGGDACAVGV